ALWLGLRAVLTTPAQPVSRLHAHILSHYQPVNMHCVREGVALPRERGQHEHQCCTGVPLYVRSPLICFVGRGGYPPKIAGLASRQERFRRGEEIGPSTGPI